MTKIERLRAALAGAEVDHPPFTVWYHFGLQHAPAERVAQAHLEFLDAYDFDWLKVMNDYSYPMPARMETLSEPRDLRRLAPFDIAQGPTGEQLKVVELLAQPLRGRVLFVDTVFNAWSTLRRNIVKGAMDPLMREHPEALETALGVVNDNLIRYALTSLQRGASGIFFSVPATAESLTPEQYETFMRPFDLAFLDAIRSWGECHILHAHGTEVYFDRLQDYPVHAISWADRESGPPLAEMRPRTALTLVGGINHVTFPDVSAAQVREQIQAAVGEAGRTKLLLAPGCAIPSFSFRELIRAARDAANKV